MPRRSGGELAMMNLIFALLIVNAASHALGDYTSLTNGIILIITIIGCNFFANVLSYRIPFFEHLVSAPPLQIIRNGQLLRHNMRREFLTEGELMSYLRQRGIEDIKEVKSAYVEGEGKITVIVQKGKI